MTRPYYVDEHKIRVTGTTSRQTVEYALVSVNDGTMVTGTDLVFMHRLADLLNEEANGVETGR